MPTFLRHKIVFGPIRSRRLGNSLGINLLPESGKICNFDCIYCECGWNKDGKSIDGFPSEGEVLHAMEVAFKEIAINKTPVDTITFSGNGEPTLHPSFPAIIDSVIELRNKYIPKAVISVLSNSTTIDKTDIRESLMKIDNPILKIDSADEKTLKLVNGALTSYSLESIIKNIKLFKGNFILQTMFLKGEYNGQEIDLSSPELVELWQKMVFEIKPRLVMLYTIDRDTPAKNLEKVNAIRMKEICAPLIEAGIKCQVAE